MTKKFRLDILFVATTSNILNFKLFSNFESKSISSCCKVRIEIHDNMVLDTLAAAEDIQDMDKVLAFVDTLNWMEKKIKHYNRCKSLTNNMLSQMLCDVDSLEFNIQTLSTA